MVGFLSFLTLSEFLVTRLTSLSVRVPVVSTPTTWVSREIERWLELHGTFQLHSSSFTPAVWDALIAPKLKCSLYRKPFPAILTIELPCCGFWQELLPMLRVKRCWSTTTFFQATLTRSLRVPILFRFRHESRTPCLSRTQLLFPEAGVLRRRCNICVPHIVG
jgi:hypothetical protein